MRKDFVWPGSEISRHNLQWNSVQEAPHGPGSGGQGSEMLMRPEASSHLHSGSRHMLWDWTTWSVHHSAKSLFQQTSLDELNGELEEDYSVDVCGSLLKPKPHHPLIFFPVTDPELLGKYPSSWLHHRWTLGRNTAPIKSTKQWQDIHHLIVVLINFPFNRIQRKYWTL